MKQGLVSPGEALLSAGFQRRATESTTIFLVAAAAFSWRLLQLRLPRARSPTPVDLRR
jgi:hypothetical protein